MMKPLEAWAVRWSKDGGLSYLTPTYPNHVSGNQEPVRLIEAEPLVEALTRLLDRFEHVVPTRERMANDIWVIDAARKALANVTEVK